MCPNERKRDRDRARYAAMSTEQRALQNKRRRELYATKNTPKNTGMMLQMTPKETAQPTGVQIILISPQQYLIVVLQDTYYMNKFLDGVVPLTIGAPDDIDDSLTETDIDTFQEMGMPLQNGGFVFNYKKSLNTIVADTIA